jgi:hypothetical protein
MSLFPYLCIKLKNMGKKERHLDLSAKFIQMGQALMIEGKEKDDKNVSLVGTILIFLGGITLNEHDVLKFSELVSMFSAKKLLDAMGALDTDEYKNMRNRADNESYDELIARLKRLRDDNKDNE